MSALPSAEFHVEPADYTIDFPDLRAVRETVFVVEQQVPIEEEWDELDPHCRHVIARDNGRRPIGTGRLTPEHRIGRMAVLEEWRGKGVGDALLLALLDEARRLGWTEVSLNAQVQAMPFYARHGFEPVGDPFWEAGIEHHAMHRALEPFDRSRSPGAAPLPANTPIQAVETLEQALGQVLQLIPASRRELCLYSRDLDPALYGHPAVLEALKDLAVAGRGASVRVLLQEPVAAQQAHHPVFAMAQRLPTVFQFRVVIEPVDVQYPAAFLINDQGGYYHRPIGSRYEGEAALVAPARARQLHSYFATVWERSRPCIEFRALGI